MKEVSIQTVIKDIFFFSFFNSGSIKLGQRKQLSLHEHWFSNCLMWIPHLGSCSAQFFPLTHCLIPGRWLCQSWMLLGFIIYSHISWLNSCLSIPVPLWDGVLYWAPGLLAGQRIYLLILTPEGLSPISCTLIFGLGFFPEDKEMVPAYLGALLTAWTSARNNTETGTFPFQVLGRISMMCCVELKKHKDLKPDRYGVELS